MKTVEFIKIREEVREVVDEKRYEHILGVSYTASSMAMRYGVDVEKARLAGLLHDYAKCMDDKKLLDFCSKHNILVTPYEKESPYLLHGKVAAYLAQAKFDVEDIDILNAISNHTTGRPGMSPLEKIIYIADFIEPNRKNLEVMPEARRLAFCDLDQCLIFILRSCLKHLENSGAKVDPTTIATYEYYKDKCNDTIMKR